MTSTVFRYVDRSFGNLRFFTFWLCFLSCSFNDTFTSTIFVDNIKFESFEASNTTIFSLCHLLVLIETALITSTSFLITPQWFEAAFIIFANSQLLLTFNVLLTFPALNSHSILIYSFFTRIRMRFPYTASFTMITPRFRTVNDVEAFTCWVWTKSRFTAVYIFTFLQILIPFLSRNTFTNLILYFNHL